MSPIVEMVNIGKKFPGVVALQGVSFSIHAGRVHVLMGENGAGKSTLMKILGGVYAPSEGHIVIDGVRHNAISVRDAAKYGISTIYQELSVIDELPVYENLFVGHMPVKNIFKIPIVDHKTARMKATEVLMRLKSDIDPLSLVGHLGISKKQIIEIAKVLISNPRVIIMDEPTSSLTQSEVTILFDIIRQLKAHGVAVVYISHKINEVVEIGDDISILRDGVMQGTGCIGNFSQRDIVQKMIGRDIRNFYVRAEKCDRSSHATPHLRITNVSSDNATSVRNVSFDVHKGEVLGFYGIVGSGRTELMNCIFGADKISSGEIRIGNNPTTIKNPLQAIKKGIALITESRRETGFFHNFSIEQNISISKDIKTSALYGMSGLLRKKASANTAKKIVERLSIKCQSEQESITKLSGGNQQKVLVGKWINTDADIFIFDEPTRGVDVAAKLEIYQIIKNLAESGKAIIIVSSDLPEIISICHRVAVFNRGKIAAFLEDENITEEKIMRHVVEEKQL